jgi:4-amino-4-deoxy-L-arabinose transferase-like glycosyltransferase
MEPKARRSALILLVLSILLAITGQHYFATKRNFIWDGISLYLIAMFVFLVVVAALEPRPRSAEGTWIGRLWPEFWEDLHGSPVRFASLALGVALIAYVTAASRVRSSPKPFGDLLILWAISIVLSVGAFVDWASLPERLRRRLGTLAKPSPETILVLALAVIALLLRITNLNGIPFVLSGDEASMGLEAIDVMEGHQTNPFVTSWFTNPTLYFFMQAASMRLFGISAAALRIPSALTAAPTLILLYLFAKRYYGRWTAILASLLFTTYHYAIHFGRIGINNIWDPFFALGAIYFFARGLESRRLGHMLASGAFTGFSVYFHAGSRLTQVIMILYLAHWALRERDLFRQNLTHLIIFGLIAAVIALPLVSFLLSHPNDMMAPWTRRAIFPLGWVDEQMKTTGRSMYSILLEQFLKSVLAFNFFPDPTFWYHPGIPLLQFLPSVFFIFGLTYAISQWRKTEYFLLAVWFIMVVIFGATLLENPPSAHRLLLSVPPVLLCVAVGMVKLASYIQQTLKQPRNVAVIISLALALFVSYQSAHFYFAVYTPSHEFAGVNTEVADRMGRYLRVLGPGYQCYFFGAPRMYYGFATIPFIARGVQGTDVLEPIQDSVTFVNPERKAVFVFLPERLNELDVVRRFYPEGSLREFRAKNGLVLFVAYEAGG